MLANYKTNQKIAFWGAGPSGAEPSFFDKYVSGPRQKLSMGYKQINRLAPHCSPKSWFAKNFIWSERTQKFFESPRPRLIVIHPLQTQSSSLWLFGEFVHGGSSLKQAVEMSLSQFYSAKRFISAGCWPEAETGRAKTCSSDKPAC